MKQLKYQYLPVIVAVVLLVIALILLVAGVTNILGLPVLSAGSFAEGYLGAGNFSIGVFSAGIFAVGVFSIGIFSVGIFSVGIFNIGIFSIGIYALGIYTASKLMIPVNEGSNAADGQRTGDGCGRFGPERIGAGARFGYAPDRAGPANLALSTPFQAK